jgi:malate dehydrogenase (oxaloacetate-decarboxylating)(NADP+)
MARIERRRKVVHVHAGQRLPQRPIDPTLRERYYPFCRLRGPANVLIMPGLHTAHITSRLLQALGVGTIIGPLLMGLEKPVEIAQMRSTVTDLVIAAALAAHESIHLDAPAKTPAAKPARRRKPRKTAPQ